MNIYTLLLRALRVLRGKLYKMQLPNTIELLVMLPTVINCKSGLMMRMKSIAKWIDDNKIFIITILAVLLAWLHYDVSPFFPLEEMREKQVMSEKRMDDLRFQKELVKSSLELGNILLDAGRYKAAENEFKKALHMDKLNQEARIGILKTEIYKDIHSNFIPDVIRKRIEYILAENRDDPHAQVLMGNLYAQKGDLSEAADRFKKLIDKGNPPSSAYFSMGLLYLKQNNIDDVLKMFEEAVNLSEFNTEYLNNLAYTYLLKDNFEAALKNYEKILRLDHEFILPYCEIALAYRLQGDLDMALEYNKKLVRLLQDEKLINLDKNKSPWLFNANPAPGLNAITLYSIRDKRVYAHLNLAAGLFLTKGEKDKTKAIEHMTKARAIKTDNKETVVDLLVRDLRRLETVRPETGDLIYEFRMELSGI
jgi:tetratricopeptide (TPR) repeat protein